MAAGPGTVPPDMAVAFRFALSSVAVVTLYFLPTYIQIFARKPVTLFARNLLIGWTVIGWIILLVSAIRPSREAADELPEDED